MVDYRCRVGTREGAIVERSVGAVSSSAARKQLQEEGFQVFQVRRSGGWLEAATVSGGPTPTAVLIPAASVAEAKTAKATLRSRFEWLRRRQIKRSDLLLFSQEMAALVRAGLPLLRCLDILRARRAGTSAGELLDRVRERVATGDDLSSAFGAEGEQYGIPPLYTTTLEIGEASGDLDGAFARVGEGALRSRGALPHDDLHLCHRSGGGRDGDRTAPCPGTRGQHDHAAVGR